MKITKIPNYYRYDVIKSLKNNSNVGIELGVAEGNFSYKMMESNKFKLFYGVDAYDEFEHNNLQYQRVLKKLSVFKNYKLIRSRFNKILNKFENQYFDFIYVDGYAHEGNNGGETIFSWFNKLKIGGVLAGDDYHKDWPLVISTVNELVRQTNLELFLRDHAVCP